MADDIRNYDLENLGFGDDEDNLQEQECQADYSPPVPETLVPETQTSTPTPTSTAPPPKPKRKGKGRYSPIWNHFKLVQKSVDGGGSETRAVCKYYGHDYAFEGGNGTGTITRHLKNLHREIYDQMMGKAPVGPSNLVQTQISSTASAGGNTTLGVWRYDQEVMREELARFMICTEQPLSLAEDRYFTRFVQKALCPQYRPISRNTCKEDMFKVFRRFKKELIAEFASVNFTIACTSDIWTGCNEVAYFCVTAHYIDRNWLLNKRIIAFRVIDSPHTGAMITNAILAIFREYKVVDKISSITFDNASANIAAIEMIRHKITPVVDESIFHGRCVCHILNLVVQDGMHGISPYLSKIRRSINLCSKSAKRVFMWKQFCASNNITCRKFSDDVQHRWNSTYLMLQSCIPYKDSLTKYVNTTQNQFYLTEDDWRVVFYFYEFLKVFFDATKALSSVYVPTSYKVLPHICEIAKALYDCSVSCPPTFRDIIKGMIDKFNKYFADMPLLYVYASVMDPRIKLEVTQYMLRHLGSCLSVDYSKLIDNLGSDIVRLYSIYESKYASSRGTTSASSSSSAPPSSSASSFIRNLVRRSASTSGTSGEPTVSEVNIYYRFEYFNAESVDFDNLDILQW